jgi:hypothetical protein
MKAQDRSGVDFGRPKEHPMRLSARFGIAALFSCALVAGDYDAIGKAMRAAWPHVATVAIVCDASGSKGVLDTLVSSLPGMKVLVVDVKGPQDMGKALGTLASRHPDAILLLASDRVVGDGSSAATFLILRMAAIKVPTVATTEAGVRQGAALGIGPGTGGRLLANTKVAGVAGVSLPTGATPI